MLENMPEGREEFENELFEFLENSSRQELMEHIGNEIIPRLLEDRMILEDKMDQLAIHFIQTTRRMTKPVVILPSLALNIADLVVYVLQNHILSRSELNEVIQLQDLQFCVAKYETRFKFKDLEAVERLEWLIINKFIIKSNLLL